MPTPRSSTRRAYTVWLPRRPMTEYLTQAESCDEDDPPALLVAARCQNAEPALTVQDGMATNKPTMTNRATRLDIVLPRMLAPFSRSVSSDNLVSTPRKL